MKLLLDTHTLLWFLEDSPRLGATARMAIEDSANDIFVSVASLWEIAIKISLGRLATNKPIDIWIPTELAANDIDLLSISIDHIIQVASLPFHHRDPFDRLLIAQSIVEAMPIVGADAAFDRYGINRLW